MSKCVDKNTLFNKLMEKAANCAKRDRVFPYTVWVDAAFIVRQAQEIEPETKISSWGKYGDTRHKTRCKNCGSERPYRKTEQGFHLVWDSPYCPNCGAKMDKEDSNNA